MRKIILGAAIAAVMATGAHASDYRAELNAIYVTGESEGVDADGFGLTGRIYFDTVDTGKGPLSEAAFLDKASSAGISWVSVEADAPGAESVDDLNLDVRVVTETDWIFEGSYNDFDGDETILGLGVGKYLTDNTDLVFSYQTYDEADLTVLGAASHTLMPLSGDTAFAYDIGASYYDGDGGSATGVEAGGTYYFNRNFGIGAEFGFVNGDGSDTSTITIAADYFFSPTANVSVAYQSLGKDADGSNLILLAGIRF